MSALRLRFGRAFARLLVGGLAAVNDCFGHAYNFARKGAERVGFGGGFVVSHGFLILPKIKFAIVVSQVPIAGLKKSIAKPISRF